MVLLVGTSGNLKACGIDFSLPSLHFPHVNDQGKFSYWEKVGEIDVGGGLVLPIHLNFNASRHSVSPTLDASGFLLGLTDATAVQLDERKFRIYTPAGRYRTFRRDRKNPNVVHSGKSWKGELKGDVLSVASECGDRLTYRQGVISEMQIKDRKFDFIRSGGKVSEIREGGKTILKVATDSMSGDVVLSYGFNKKIVFQFGERPVVQVIKGKNVVGQKERSLCKIVGENGFTRDFEFAVNKDIQPTMKVGNEKFVWNPTNGFMISDGIWQYDIKPGEADSANAVIARINFEGGREFWHRNRSKGEEIIENVDGTRKITTWFTSGQLAGRKRVIQKVKNNKKTTEIKFLYDENGKRRKIRVNKNALRHSKQSDLKLTGIAKLVNTNANFISKKDYKIDEYERLRADGKIEIFVVKNGKTSRWMLKDQITGEVLKNKIY